MVSKKVRFLSVSVASMMSLLGTGVMQSNAMTPGNYDAAESMVRGGILDGGRSLLGMGVSKVGTTVLKYPLWTAALTAPVWGTGLYYYFKDKDGKNICKVDALLMIVQWSNYKNLRGLTAGQLREKMNDITTHEQSPEFNDIDPRVLNRLIDRVDGKETRHGMEPTASMVDLYVAITRCNEVKDDLLAKFGFKK